MREPGFTQVVQIFFLIFSQVTNNLVVSMSNLLLNDIKKYISAFITFLIIGKNHIVPF